MCARASAIYALLFVYIHIHIHTCTCLRSKGGRELGERVGRRVGGGAASAWHCHFQGERGEQNCKCNHRQANKYTVSFFRLPFVILLWRSRCSTISLSHSLCVQQRGQLCALRSTGRRVLRGVGVAACLQLSLLLLDLFCIQRTATHTHTHQRRARTHIHTYTSGVHACMCMHIYSYLFIICILLQKIVKILFFFLATLASIDSPDTWPFWASPSRRRSKAQSRCDRQAFRLFRFQFQLNLRRRRRCRRTTMTTRRRLHSDRAIVFWPAARRCFAYPVERPQTCCCCHPQMTSTPAFAAAWWTLDCRPALAMWTRVAAAPLNWKILQWTCWCCSLVCLFPVC